MKHSKKYREVAKKVDSSKFYSVDDSLKLVKETSYTKFPGSLDIVINFSIPAKKKDEVFRGSVILPHQSGPSKKVVVIADAAGAKIAMDAGADEAGAEELLKKIEGGFTDFDVLIATPPMMIKLAKLGKVLGPKGLMPNPKNNTVTTNIEEVVKSYKAGKMDFRVNDQASVKGQIGKLDSTEAVLKENFVAFCSAVYNETKKLGPNRIKSVVISATMGPAIKVDNSDILKILG